MLYIIFSAVSIICLIIWYLLELILTVCALTLLHGMRRRGQDENQRHPRREHSISAVMERLKKIQYNNVLFGEEERMDCCICLDEFEPGIEVT